MIKYQFRSIPAFCFLSILSSFLFMITLQRFIDFLSIYSLYFYKHSKRDRGCSFYFRDFTIRDISTFSPELLLLCFCGLNSTYIFQFCGLNSTYIFLIIPPTFLLLLCSINFAHIPFCLCPGFTLNRALFGYSSLYLSTF